MSAANNGVLSGPNERIADLERHVAELEVRLELAIAQTVQLRSVLLDLIRADVQSAVLNLLNDEQQIYPRRQ